MTDMVSEIWWCRVIICHVTREGVVPTLIYFILFFMYYLLLSAFILRALHKKIQCAWSIGFMHKLQIKYFVPLYNSQWIKWGFMRFASYCILFIFTFFVTTQLLWTEVRSNWKVLNWFLFYHVFTVLIKIHSHLYITLFYQYICMLMSLI